ncbi:MAG: hypothetical protein E6K78_00455 [Candidatus Eisenbacteria bacterium]|uniref:Energy-coupling factor transporter transmembrane protein EcfT n=1 Tax=Eiseniibacteriota bacterium TaxID=2212470 RepID=A0A538TYN2_UNCEI|nr:MAG: hypothetical protein E6K78_00455 [Candidatus Eisenbacteria bacterium]
MTAVQAIAPARERAAVPLLVGALVGSLCAGRLESAILCLAVAVVAAACVPARWPSRAWLVALVPSTIVAWVLNLYLTPGDALVGPRLLGRAPTAQGLRLGTLLILRLAGALASLQGLRAAWNPQAAVDRAARWLSPFERLRVPVREIRMMLSLAVRFAPLLEAEARRIAAVQDLRAGRPPRGAREWLTRRRAVALPTLVGALERAERVALALEARHFRMRPAAPASPVRGASVGWTLAAVAVAGTALLWRG